MLERHEAIMTIMLASLREERALTYSPFLPIHPKTRQVMQVAVDEWRVADGTIVWRDPDSGERFETPVTGGHSPSCNGSPTGRCAGSRSASTTKWRARTSSIP